MCSAGHARTSRHEPPQALPVAVPPGRPRCLSAASPLDLAIGVHRPAVASPPRSGFAPHASLRPRQPAFFAVAPVSRTRATPSLRRACAPPKGGAPTCPRTRSLPIGTRSARQHAPARRNYRSLPVRISRCLSFDFITHDKQHMCRENAHSFLLANC